MVAAASFTVERFTVESDNTFDETLQKLRAGVGHPNLPTFLGEIKTAKSEEELEEIVNREVSPLGLLEFVTFDLGEVLQKELGDKAPRSLRRGCCPRPAKGQAALPLSPCGGNLSGNPNPSSRIGFLYNL